MRLRPVDLAELVGVSTQQVRNYQDAGVLPPVPRTAAGYRTFDERHSQAMLTYRALIRGYGPAAAQAIMRAVQAGDLPGALAVIDASHAALHDQRRSLREVDEALEAVAEQFPDTSALPRSGLRIGEVAAYLGVRTSALRVWENSGLLTPERERGTRYRRYSADDVRDARMVVMLRQGRYPLPQVRAILAGLREAGSSDALRAAIAQRREGLARQARVMLESSSSLHHYLDDRRNMVQLRNVEDADIEVFYEDQRDPQATAMAVFPARPREACFLHWAKIRANDSNILRTVVVADAVAGNVVSWEQDGQRLIGYWIGRSFWGKGVATAALTQYVEELSQRPLYAHVAASNTGSVRVLEKCGFQPTGEILHEGDIDEIVLALK
ncbi:GNAT family N-acetyltransferase [Fodinicola feengrottensis]|uniref:GNAT family N-acetyltransferase n=1 Tax=Fodinicola feengrottensis TaxID=435914 RepID=A0ABP4S2N6_9ACTN|nr:GNAT family N-acetyltransferase [Fodinicola feengrottensis]